MEWRIIESSSSSFHFQNFVNWINLDRVQGLSKRGGKQVVKRKGGWEIHNFKHTCLAYMHTASWYISAVITYILSLRNTVNNSEPGDVVPRAVLRKYLDIQDIPLFDLRTERAKCNFHNNLKICQNGLARALHGKWTSEGLQTRSTDAGVVSTQRDSTNLDKLNCVSGGIQARTWSTCTCSSRERIPSYMTYMCTHTGIKLI